MWRGTLPTLKKFPKNPNLLKKYSSLYSKAFFFQRMYSILGCVILLLDISLCAWLSIWPPPEELGPEEAAASKKTQARARKITARKTAGLLQSFSLASRIMIVLYCLCAGAQNMVQLSLPGLSRALPGLSRASSEAIANLRSRFVAEELPPPQPLPLPTRKHRLFLGAWRGSSSPANRRRLFVMAEEVARLILSRGLEFVATELAYMADTRRLEGQMGRQFRNCLAHLACIHGWRVSPMRTISQCLLYKVRLHTEDAEISSLSTDIVALGTELGAAVVQRAVRAMEVSVKAAGFSGGLCEGTVCICGISLVKGEKSNALWMDYGIHPQSVLTLRQHAVSGGMDQVPARANAKVKEPPVADGAAGAPGKRRAPRGTGRQAIVMDNCACGW
jgi:hypothetical protein